MLYIRCQCADGSQLVSVTQQLAAHHKHGGMI